MNDRLFDINDNFFIRVFVVDDDDTDDDGNGG